MRPLLVRTCQRASLRSHFERIENLVGVGTPDVDYCIAGVPGKIELKYTPGDPARPTTAVLGRTHGMRRSQIVWAVRRMMAGGRVLLCVGSPLRVWVLRLETRTPEQMRDIEMMGADQLTRECVWSNTTHEPFQLIEVLMAAPGEYVMGAPLTQKGDYE